METTTQPTVKTFTKKNCEECGNEFDVKKFGAKFCSDVCRGRAHRKMKRASRPEPQSNLFVKSEDFPAVTTKHQGTHLVASLNGLPPHAQYIITHLREQLSERKDELTRLRDKYETARKEKGDLEKKIAKLELDHKIESIENAKPSGLQGVMQNLGSLPPEVLASLAPAVTRIVEKIFGDGPAQLPIAGTDGQLDETQTKLQSFNQWFAGLPKQMQDAVYAMLVKLANAPSEQALQQTLNKILSIINHATATPTIPFTGTFN